MVVQFDMSTISNWALCAMIMFAFNWTLYSAIMCGKIKDYAQRSTTYFRKYSDQKIYELKWNLQYQ
ncbi:hypothetical protein BCR32DRAFT_290586 [Anaeromyces robustus]|uniref:Uncharacterized protein n=1 Tax=Anaeromyces robustus TaxID=1754192 RepID=A0A1Y1XIL5_9FUNG|nr:hypothetical protein BCR32DRAFT_290586 [Anaeromyces robustus]|eukprot:ORX85600.1 hypothetical protein BCR32DRAFT_290586 [Anaeromyces robustus]